MIHRRLLVALATFLVIMPAASPDPGRGLRVPRMKAPVLLAQSSWYGPRFHGRLQANGRPFNQRAMTCAHKSFRLGTPLLVINPETKVKTVLIVTDRGPYVGNRALDVSTRAAEILGFKRKGVTTLVIRPLSPGIQGIQEAWSA